MVLVAVGATAFPADRHWRQVAAVATDEAEADLYAQAISCRQELGGVLTTLSHLGSRLDVGVALGVAKSDYTHAVQDVQVAWDHLDAGRLSPNCVTEVSSHIQAALTRYKRAAKIWNRCTARIGCDMHALTSIIRIQIRWMSALSEIQTAKDDLLELGSAAGSASI